VKPLTKDIPYDEFQDTVSELLVCNKSILDILAKFQESNARLNRAIVKSVTGCGCTRIDATKKDIPKDAVFSDLKDILESHLKGELCEGCRDSVEQAIGSTLFYIAAICNLLDLNLCEIITKEQKHLKILGLYNLA
jgi:hypothetical protein